MRWEPRRLTWPAKLFLRLVVRLGEGRQEARARKGRPERARCPRARRPDGDAVLDAFGRCRSDLRSRSDDRASQPSRSLTSRTSPRGRVSVTWIMPPGTTFISRPLPAQRRMARVRRGPELPGHGIAPRAPGDWAAGTDVTIRTSEVRASRPVSTAATPSPMPSDDASNTRPGWSVALGRASGRSSACWPPHPDHDVARVAGGPWRSAPA